MIDEIGAGNVDILTDHIKVVLRKIMNAVFMIAIQINFESSNDTCHGM